MGASTRPARILVVGTHPHARQRSMTQFAGWFEQALTPIAHVDAIRAPALFRRRPGRMGGLAKWLAYLDQYVVLTLWLAVRSRAYDLVLVADHSNGPSAWLTPRPRRVIMVHDTIPLRQARGELGDAPPVGRAGRWLQSLILAGLNRASLLLINPGPVDAELTALGVTGPRTMVGCPADPQRLDAPTPPVDPPQGPFLLNVGSDGWRKRKVDLVRLWAADTDRKLPSLVLVGQTETATVAECERLGLGDRVTFHPNASDAELGWFYRNSSGLVVAGHHEGFCIPVVEAFHCGKPVFAPATATLYPAIFGDAVSLIDMAAPATGAAQLAERLATGSFASAEVRDAAARKWSRAAFEARVRAAVLAKLGLDESRAAVDEH